MPKLTTRTTALSLQLTDLLYIARSPYTAVDDRKILIADIFNSTNLSLTFGLLNTIQDINISASPRFNALSLNTNAETGTELTILSHLANSNIITLLSFTSTISIFTLSENSSGNPIFTMRDNSTNSDVILSGDSSISNVLVNDTVMGNAVLTPISGLYVAKANISQENVAAANSVTTTNFISGNSGFCRFKFIDTDDLAATLRYGQGGSSSADTLSLFIGNDEGMDKSIFDFSSSSINFGTTSVGSGKDFIIKSENGTNSFFLDGVDGTVGIGTNTITSGFLMEVNGNFLADNVNATNYDPTITNVANVNAASSSVIKHYVMHIGNVVTVSGGVTIVPSGTFDTFSFRLSLPISSDLGTPEDGVGNGIAYQNGLDTNQSGIFISAEGTNDEMLIQLVQFAMPITSLDSIFCRYEFKYIIQ